LGLTLIEVLLALTVLVIMGTLSIGAYRNYAKNVELDMTVKTIRAELSELRGKALNGESRLNWGAHFVNSTNDYYELFSSPTNYSDVNKVIKSTTYLKTTVNFSSPGSGSNTDVIFNKITGGVDSNVGITITSEGQDKSINISTIGAIY